MPSDCSVASTRQLIVPRCLPLQTPLQSLGISHWPHKQGKSPQVCCTSCVIASSPSKPLYQVSTFLWVAEASSVPNIGTWLKEAQDVEFRTKKKQVVQLVVYDLPDRDCSAKASSGEFDLADGGEEKYKVFIQQVHAQLARFPNIRVVIQLETDAIGNFVTGGGRTNHTIPLKNT